MTKRNNDQGAFCLACFTLGYAAPWIFLVLGAVLGLFSTAPYLQETSAWLTAIGMFLLALSYFFARLMHRIKSHT